MPELVALFFIGLVISFMGSVPPGSINLTALQLSLVGRKKSAVYFSLAAVIVEFFYACIAVNFQILLTKNTVISSQFQIVTAIALVALGMYNFSKKASKSKTKVAKGGFVKGLILGLANPLCIPFWLGVTAYLQSNGFVKISGLDYLIYSAGISVGTFLLLLLAIRMAHFFEAHRDNTFIVYQVPGAIFTLMGMYAFYNWMVAF